MDTGEANGQVAIEVQGIRKNYGHLQALRGVDLKIYKGEILALIGDNGAGKSTLAKIICGAIQKSEGSLYFWGEKTDVQSINHAHNIGVFTVYQDLSLAPDLPVSDNLFLGREIMKTGILGRMGALDRKAMRNQSKQALASLGIGLKSISVDTRALSGGERQALAIAKAVTWANTALIMDEPTAALGARQSAIVYDTIKAAASRGLAVLVISHDIPKMVSFADRIVVLRHGQIVANLEADHTNLQEVLNYMLGGKGETKDD
jgi:simple sugar transport system ATP-binding protein